MKINGKFNNMNVNPYKKQLDKQAVQDIKKQQQADKLEISSEAKQLQQQSRIEVERQEKVEALKKQVQAGEYKVNAHAVAKSMYEFWTKK